MTTLRVSFSPLVLSLQEAEALLFVAGRYNPMHRSINHYTKELEALRSRRLVHEYTSGWHLGEWSTLPVHPSPLDAIQDAWRAATAAPAPAPVRTPPPTRHFEVLSPYQQELAKEGHCMADDDGYCCWEGCPQIRDNEPTRSGRHCPRDIATRARLDPDNEGRAGNG